MNTGLQQFISVALPIMVTLVATFWIASWSQNKRFDDLRSDINRPFEDSNRPFDDVNRRPDERFEDANHRLDELRTDMNRRFEEVNVRLGRIETKLDGHEERIVRLKERTSPVRR